MPPQLAENMILVMLLVAAGALWLAMPQRADWFRVFIGVVLPLLAIASVIEVYITPMLIKMAFPYL